MDEKKETVETRTDPVPPDWAGMYQQLVSRIGSPIAIDTPQLGRVEYPRPAELFTAMNILKLAAAEASGVSAAGVIVCGYNRGLGWPKGGC